MYSNFQTYSEKLPQRLTPSTSSNILLDLRTANKTVFCIKCSPPDCKLYIKLRILRAYSPAVSPRTLSVIASKSTTLKYLVRATAKLSLLSLYISAIIRKELFIYIPIASLISFLLRLSPANASPMIFAKPVPILAIPPVTLKIIYLAEVILRAKSAYLFNLDFSLNCSKIRRRVKP